MRPACQEVPSARIRLNSASTERLRAKDAFYNVLFDGAASEPLKQMITMLQSRVRVLRWTSLSVPGRPEETIREMGAIVEAIEARDADGAAAACAAHVRNAGPLTLHHAL